MKRIAVKVLMMVFAVIFATGLSACSKDDNNATEDLPNNDIQQISLATAYAQASELGFTGSLDEFVKLISGKDGVDGKNGLDGKDGADGKDGLDGKDGADGKNGLDGKDGRGITRVSVTASGDLNVHFSDGTVVNVGSVIIKCNHNYGAWHSDKSATCTSVGYDTRICDKCGNIEYRFTDELGHNYDNPVTVIAKHCTETGLEVLTCTRCGDTQSKPIAPAGHEFSVPSMTCIYCGKNVHDINLEKDFRFKLINGGTEYEIRAKSTSIEGDIVLPIEYNGKSVTRVAKSGFGNCKKIASVTIPDGYVEIGDNAFRYAIVSGTFIISKTVKTIGRNAFSRLKAEQIQIDPENDMFYNSGNCIIEKTTKTLLYGSDFNDCPSDGSIKHIGERAFAAQSDIDNLVIPEGVESIGGYAFSGCDNIKQISLPDTLCFIGSGAFNGTAYVKNPDNWTDGALYIGRYLIRTNDALPDEYTVRDGTIAVAGGAFYSSDVKKLVIADTVKYICESAFLFCGRLTDINIGSAVQVIDVKAFLHCDALERAVFKDPTGWSRITTLNGCEEIAESDIISPQKAAELLRETTITVSVSNPDGFLFYHYVWNKA